MFVTGYYLKSSKKNKFYLQKYVQRKDLLFLCVSNVEKHGIENLWPEGNAQNMLKSEILILNLHVQL